jgi:hypothetical protein
MHRVKTGQNCMSFFELQVILDYFNEKWCAGDLILFCDHKSTCCQKTKQTHVLILCKMVFCWLCMPLYARSLTMLESECDNRKCLLQCGWANALLIHMQARWQIQRSNSVPLHTSVDVSPELSALSGYSTSWCEGQSFAGVHRAPLQVHSSKHF